MNPTTPASNTRFITAFILVFTGILFLFNIGARDLWAPDEPRYAQVAKEMRDAGNHIVPRLNGAPYPDKPPLLFWLINLFSLPYGRITELSARLPSALAGMGCCLVLFHFGKALYRNTRISLFAALILATSSKFLWMAHRVAFDVLLTFFVTAALYCFYQGYTMRRGCAPAASPPATPPDNTDKNRERWYCLLFYAFMAMGVLAKGPIGFILPFCTVLAYLVIKRDVRYLKEAMPWPGGALFAVLVFTWVYLAVLYGGKDYAYQILFKQNVGRFAGSFAHKRPFYYYFVNFPINFFPWCVFIPSVAIYLSSRKGREKTRNVLLPLVWFAVVFIFFSITSGKRDIYVLPLYPAAALLLAWFLNEFIERFRDARFKNIGYYPCYLLCGVSLVSGILLPAVIYKRFPQYASLTFPFAVILVAGGVVMFRCVRRARIIPFLLTLFFVIFTTFNVSTIRVIPLLNQFKSAKEICGKASAIMKSGEKLALYNFFRDPYLFYTNRNHVEVIDTLDNLRQFLHSNGRVFLFIQEKDFQDVSKRLEMPMFVLAGDSVGHRDVLFVSNKDM